MSPKQQISAEVVADSVADHGIRITTVAITFPKWLQAELNTHRMISKNAASSRAIPTAKVIEQVARDPFVPKVFTKNQKGMTANEPLPPEMQELARKAWLIAAEAAATQAAGLVAMGVAKQYASRLLEPFMWTRALLTSTEWKNFFALRIHESAQPEMRELAEKIRDALDSSIPVDRSLGSNNLPWHLPFIDHETLGEIVDYAKERDGVVPDIQGVIGMALKRSVARCARVSYNNFEGKRSTVQQDVDLFTKLVGERPMHASPAEHQARAFATAERSGNLVGWEQFRKMLVGEYVSG